MQKVKPTVLFNFGYNRKGWIAPIEALHEHLDIVYLYYLSPEQETVNHTKHRVIYWNQFQTADDLIAEIRPAKIVFMSIESGVGILLNYTAKKRKIPTYILQHGMFSHYADYRQRERKMKKMNVSQGDVATLSVAGFSTASFYRRSLKKSDYFAFLLFPLYFWLMKRNGARFASRWVRFAARMPDFYICYTPQNAIIHRELDNPRKDQFLFIGNPELDVFFTDTAQRYDTSDYFLLIDQPFADNRYREHICSREQMIEHYLRLSRFARASKARLKIKLHPESYHSTWLPDDPNIDWIKDHTDLPALIKEAKGCFGYFSTLLIPAIFFNRCVLFRVSDNEMQVDAAKAHLVHLLDFFTYSEQDIRFDDVKKDDLNIFVKKYLLYDDGRSVQRLREVLN